VNRAVSALLALARALRVGQVTPAEVADRLVILAHRVHIHTTRAKVSPVRDEILAPSLPNGASVSK
jgi:hypothetical protein